MARQLPRNLVLVSAVLAVVACGRKPEPAEVTITLKDTPGSLSAATVAVDYTQASASPFRSGGEPACAAIVPNLTATFTDDGQGSLTIHANAKAGFSAPVDLAVCRMVPDAPGVTADEIASHLRITLLSGTDLAGKPVAEQRLARAGDEPRRAGNEGQPTARPAAPAAGTGAGAPVDDEPAAADEARPQGSAHDRVAAATPPPAGAPGAPVPAPAAPNALVPEGGNASRGNAPGGGSGGGGGGTDGGGDEGTNDDTAGAADSNDETDAARDAVSYSVTVEVANPVGKLGALQFNVNHHGSGGGFAGAGGSARCASVVPAAIATFNDTGGGTLRAGMIDLDGFDTPGPVVSCTFKSRGSVNPGDFSVELVDAANIEGKPPTKSPQLAVRDIRAQ
jgi:hypothetical protein